VLVDRERGWSSLRGGSAYVLRRAVRVDDLSSLLARCKRPDRIQQVVVGLARAPDVRQVAASISRSSARMGPASKRLHAAIVEGPTESSGQP